MATSTPNYAGTAINIPTTGFPWVNPSNATGSPNASYATVTMTGDLTLSDEIYVTFTVTVPGTVTGVRIRTTATMDSIVSGSYSLLYCKLATGTQLTPLAGIDWNDGFPATLKTFGTTSNALGLTAANFAAGVTFALWCDIDIGDPTNIGYIDAVNCEITYTPSAGGQGRKKKMIRRVILAHRGGRRMMGGGR